MTTEQIKNAREANPFRPFTLMVADGRSHRIPHRDYISVSPSGRTIVVYHTDDSCSIVDLLLVTELLIDAPPQPVEPAA